MYKKIDLTLGTRSYPIHIGTNLSSRRADLICQKITSAQIGILAVEDIFRKYGKKLARELTRKGRRVKIIMIPDGEDHKDEKTLLSILSKMKEMGFRRDSCLLALGGGVVGDVGGFAASIYMRGIDFVQYPTTLLAQVDAGIGGKTGIDFEGIKNLLGSFHQPRMVLIDTSALTTLTDREFRNGLAEIVKYGVIADESLFARIEKNIEGILNRQDVIFDLVYRSCRIKARIVSGDEFEYGCRSWLNYGHTLGHALESYFEYSVLKHGEAVAIGMVFAAFLSFRLGLCSKETVARQCRLISKLGLLRGSVRFDAKKVYEKMLLDKKTRSGGVQFVLTKKIGLVTIRKNIPPKLVHSTLVQFQAACNAFIQFP